MGNGIQEFGGMVVIQQETTFIGTGSLFGRVTMGVAAVEVKAGGARLSGRSMVSIQAHPDNTANICIGLTNAVSLTSYMLVLTPGQGITFKIKATDDMQLWGISSAATQYVGVLEATS